MRRLIAAFVCFFMAGGAGWAQHEGSHKQEKKTEEKKAEASGMPEDMQKMMEAWAKYASPGEHHAALDSMAGDWKIEGKFRMSPESEWMDSPSKASIEWVLGGRFLRQEVSSPPSPMMPQPFEGVGYLGYDNGAQRYVSSWMDTMSTVLDLGAVALSAEQVGGAQFVLEMAVQYAKDRVQFGRPIGSFQAIKHKCADMLLEVESAKSAAYYGLWCAAEMNDELPSVASLAKSYCSEAYFHAAAENIQIHGGIGFTWEHPAHLYFKRAKSSELLFGDPAYHRELLAQRIGL